MNSAENLTFPSYFGAHILCCFMTFTLLVNERDSTVPCISFIWQQKS